MNLWEAARDGNTEEVIRLLTTSGLLRRKADVNEKDKEGNTALMWAARYLRVKTMQVLLNAGADINAQDNDGETALIQHANSDYTDIMETLLASGANLEIHGKYGVTALMKAVSYRKIKAVKVLLAAGAKIEAQDEYGHTAFMKAASNYESTYSVSQEGLEIIRLLVASGANIEAKDKYGQTALMRAVLEKKLSTVLALLEVGAKTDTQDKDGRTALLIAANKAEREIVRALLKAGAKTDIRNKDGETALDIAIEKQYPETISILQNAAKEPVPAATTSTAKVTVSQFSRVTGLAAPYGGAGSSASLTHKESAPAATASHSSSVTASVASTTSKAHGGAGQSSGGASSSAKAVVPTPASYAVIPYTKLQFTGKVLGEGGFGIVKEAKWNFMDVAVKQFKAIKLADDALLELESEAKRHAALRFPSIVQLYGVCLEAFKYCMVMELMVGGSLYEVLHNGKELPWDIRLSIAKDIAAGLSYLHENGILHRDLKSLNVLLDDRMRAKLSDFGLSKVKTESTIATAGSKQAVGTLNWMAPELFRMGAKYNELTDIYALGQVLWEIASRKVPYHEANGKDALIKDWIKEGNRNEVPDETPPKYATLIQQCWAQDPKSRPQAAGEIAESLSQYQIASVMQAHGGAGRSDRPADSIGNKLFS